MTSDLTDASLVRAAQDGDGHAFAALVSRHGRAVRSTVWGHLRDSDATDDAMQESFTRALDRLTTLRDPDRFRPWLLQIARNTAADIRRQRGRVILEPLDESGEDGAAPALDAPGPDVQAELRELVDLVRGGVQGLSPRDATALSMVLWLGFGPSEVGAGLGITTNAAKVMLHRARARLRDALLVEVASAARHGGCDEVMALLGDDDRSGALRHVRSCPQCDSSGKERLGVGPQL